MPILFLFFLTMPIVEMYLLIQVGGWIGALPTIGLVALTAVVGMTLLRQQGFATLLRGQQRMAEGQLPAQELMEGFALAVGGALLLTPGFVTDAVGFALLLPLTRRMLVGALVRRGVWQMQQGPGGWEMRNEGGQWRRDGASRAQFRFEARMGGKATPHTDPRIHRGSDGGRVIEGEFERTDDDSRP
mgnify:CR=1 FL=1